MTALTTSDFRSFFQELWNGAVPFDWQQELVDQIIETRRWPDLIDIPTGLGKTTAIDIALFALAVETSETSDRSAWVFPHRIAMVVDRRVIVDQAAERANAIRDAIVNAPPGSTCARVRDALYKRAGQELTSINQQTPPLLSSVLRGGIVRDETWARHPEIPAVLASTVDQVGSRLLFRGYGLSTGARPIHAGLLANDTLYLLDEVHLARPFAETLTAVAELSTRGEVSVIPRRFGVVQLSATPFGKAETRFPERPLDRPTTEQTPTASNNTIAARRLGSSKPAELIEVKVPIDAAKANQTFAKEVAAQVQRRIPGNTRIAVMVNRVDTARRVAALLQDNTKTADSFDVVLLTGRMRPVDRDHVVANLIGNRLAPKPRDNDEKPIVVVATQSLEAGADFDFDVLITECASIDALRQRFGRVDRDGQRWISHQTSTSAVLCRSTDAQAKKPDPVYGNALAATWQWLIDQEVIDFGYGAMPNPSGNDLAPLLPPIEHAPRLAATHLDRWVQTSEREVSAEPDVAQWLHGIAATDPFADVQVVWREAVDPALLSWPTESHVDHRPHDEDAAIALTELIEALPPLAAETLGVPIGEVRRWLNNEENDPLLADAPGTSTADQPSHSPRSLRRVIRWSGDGVEVITASQVRPGDTIVVPATAGGIKAHNWDPTSDEPVHDVSEKLRRDSRGVVAILLTPKRCKTLRIDPPDREALEHVPASQRIATLTELIETRIDDLGLTGVELTPWRASLVPTRADSDGVIQSDFLLTARVRDTRTEDNLATDSTDDALSLIGQPVRLDNHLAGVGNQAQAFGAALGWSDATVRAVRLAGELHDVGKADSRFQFMLAGGSIPGTLLAKSSMTATDGANQRITRRNAGYPIGTRHELMSLALIADLDDLVQDNSDLDTDLVKYLVATHHGWGRYRFRPSFDNRPETVTLSVNTDALGSLSLSASSDHGLEAIGSGHAERFWDLTYRYGWWTLAYLEAVVRLADHRRSQLEQFGAVEQDAYVKGV